MPSSWIYLFADPRYERGVKIGYCSSKGARSAWLAAPSYSPAGIEYLAGWSIELPVAIPDGRTIGAIRNLESLLQGLVGIHLHTMRGHERSGRDWVEGTRTDANRTISHVLGKAPDLRDVHVGRPVTENDNLRQPHPSDLAAYGDGRFNGTKRPAKVAVWIYEEGQTGRLKTQFVHDWTSPFEKARRYSRNGFAERCAFTYPGPPTGSGNVGIHKAWQTVMTHFGPGPDDRRHGWLNPDVPIADVAATYEANGLVSLPLDRKSVPQGIRPSYNRSW
jgi:hypothetical protein